MNLECPQVRGSDARIKRSQLVTLMASFVIASRSDIAGKYHVDCSG